MPDRPISQSQRLSAEARSRAKKHRRQRRKEHTGERLWFGYLRISRDATARGLGVDRQKYLIEERVAQIGGTVVAWFSDNDTSGGDFTVRRGYEDMLGAIANGEGNGIIAAESERLTREGMEDEELLLIAEDLDLRVYTLDGGDLDFSRPDVDDQVMSSRFRKSVKTADRAKTRRRIRNKHDELARNGKVSGGGPRPFGFEDDRVTIRPAEAELIREAVKRVLRDEPILSIIRDWHARGIVAPEIRRVIRDPDGEPTKGPDGARLPSIVIPGKPWTASAFRRMLMRGRNCGWRDHLLAENGLHGEMVSEAEWPAIVKKTDIERVRKLLCDPSRRTNARQRKYLLTGGMARCGECGTAMIARSNNGKPCYRCSSEPRHGGCGRCFQKAEPFEEEVEKRFFAALNDKAMLRAWQEAEALEPTDHTVVIAAIEDDEALLDVLADQLGDGLDARRYKKQVDKVNARLVANRKLLTKAPTAAAVIAEHGGVSKLMASWSEMSTGQRRAVLSRVIDRVEVKRGLKGRNWFDPERIRVVWLGMPGDG